METAVATVSQQTGFVERMLNKIESLEQAKEFGAFVIKSGFAPPHYKTPEQAILAIDAGMRLGFTWSQALQEGYVVNGIPSYKAMGFKALVLSSGKCDKWENSWEGSIESGDLSCIITHRRKGEEKDTVRRFGILEAQRAGLWNKNDVWKKNPEIMLESRNSARVCEKDYPDVTKGFMSKETAEDYPTLEINTDTGMVVSSLKMDKAQAMEKAASEFNAPKEKKTNSASAKKTAIKTDAAEDANIVKEEPKLEKEDITIGLSELKGPDLWNRLTDNFPYANPDKLFDDKNIRTVKKVFAIIIAIHDGTLDAHLKEKYPHFEIESPNKETVTSSESAPDINLDGITEPGENGRDMLQAVKVCDLFKDRKTEEELLDMYSDSFQDIDDFYAYATLEQIRTALS